MNRQIAAILATSALALSLGACSDETTVAADPEAAPVVTESTTAPEPTTMTKKQAGVYYLTAVCPGNAAMYKFWDKYGGKYQWEVDLSKLRSAARGTARQYREAAMALQNPPLDWPKNVRKDAIAVSKILLADVTYYNQSLGMARSWDDWVARSNQKGAKGDNRAPEQVRLTLGLGAAGKCPDWANNAKKPVVEKP